MVVCPACGEENPERAKFCLTCGAPLAETAVTAAEVRKTVTILFADVTGSTQLGEKLDPESVRRLMGRYFEEMQAVLERHGGAVEKFIGDAVMAVFGVPVLHEDDPVRAVRAAVEMRDALAALNEDFQRERGVGIQLRIGVNTGEVVVGGSLEGQPFATGDAVNVAARLEQAAAPGEILIGERTRSLVADGISAEPTEPLTLKGKSAPVAAWRLVAVSPDVPAFTSRIATPFVGREHELASLLAALERASDGRVCELCTVVGPPGIGKSRLAREFVAEAAGRARIVIGRCLPYGRGITFWPLGEIVRQLGGTDPRAGLRGLLADEERPELIADRIGAAVGLVEGHGQAEETFWAFRKLFERLGRSGPVVAVIDDIHWAEPTLLDLLEYLVSFSSDAAILLLCLARADLFDERPSWAVPREHTSLLSLAPLTESEAEILVGELAGTRNVDRPVRERILETAEGNPLFVEQILALRSTSDDSAEVAVPPTIEALLAARIDRLPSDERAVLERASVEGRVFHRGALATLLPAETRRALDAQLMSLARKEFIRPDRARFPGDDGFRFVHALVRDAAYQSISKHQRSDLHERFAQWLERAAADGLVEYEEIVGYHLEQAYRYREQLGPVDDAGRTLAHEAAERLVAAGTRAVARRDLSGAESLLTRGCALLDEEDPLRFEALVELADSVVDGGDISRGETLLTEVVEGAEQIGADAIAAHARLRRVLARVHTGAADKQAVLAEAEAAIETFARLGDEQGLAHAWALVGRARFWLGRAAEAEDAYRKSVAYARRSGDRRRETEVLAWWIGAKAYGPAPVSEGIDFCDEILARHLGDPVLDIFAFEKRGILEAMSGRPDDGRTSVREAQRLGEELGLKVRSGMSADYAGLVELVAGDLDAAERELRAGYELLGSIGEDAFRSALAMSLSEVLYRQSRYEEALELLDFEDATIGARRGKILARKGDLAEGERLARHAVESWEASDYLVERADALMDLAEVLRLARRPAESAGFVSEALRLYEEKGNIAFAAKARAVLGELSASASRPLA